MKLNYVVRVNRSKLPPYPKDTKIVHRKLEQVGLEEYDLSIQVYQWRHPQQKKGKLVRSGDVFEELEEEGALASCPGFHDALAIQEKGFPVFNHLFGGRALWFIKTKLKDVSRHDHYVVPCLFTVKHKIVLEVKCLSFFMNLNDVIPRFK